MKPANLYLLREKVEYFCKLFGAVSTELGLNEFCGFSVRNLGGFVKAGSEKSVINSAPVFKNFPLQKKGIRKSKPAAGVRRRSSFLIYL